MSVIRPFSDVDLHAFVDDQVSPERRSMIANYLKITPAEAQRVDSWRRQNEAIRNVFAGAASEPVPIWLTIGQLASSRERLHVPSADRTVLGGAASRQLRRVSAGWPGFGLHMLMAAMVTIAFAAGVVAPAVAPQWAAAVERWFPGSPRAEALRGFAARTREAHRTYGIDPDRPAEMTDVAAGALDAWFRHKVAFPVRIPDLRSSGWTLRGGRVVPGDIGAAALLVYEDAVGDRLSLTIGRVNNPSTFDTSYEIVDGPVLVWMDGPLGFGIATSREGPWLPDHARALYRAVYQSQAE